jgi:hypothetical protein
MLLCDDLVYRNFRRGPDGCGYNHDDFILSLQLFWFGSKDTKVEVVLWT